MQQKNVLSYSSMIAVAILVGTMKVEAQITVDSGMVRELLLVVANPGLPEWGVSECFQIGDTLFYRTLTTAFYTFARPKGKEFQYFDIDSQVVERLNHVADSLSDKSWYDLGEIGRVSPLHSGSSVIDSNMYGACREYAAKYAVVNASSNCEGNGNLFADLGNIGNIKGRHVVLLRVDTSTVQECRLDKWILDKIVEKETYVRTVVIRPKK